ncbi:MAG TPA: hypothetical protein VNP04_08055 [Alphaproteobacteria bacterium]|nr:hypothetical protein [Alphaproteobacteria bacterium]
MGTLFYFTASAEPLSFTEGEVLTYEAKLDRVLARAWQGENGHGSWLAHLARTDVTLHHTAPYTYWVRCHYNETIRRETDPLPNP